MSHSDISGIYHARGDYDTALDFLQQSLAIQQEIGDVAGLCATTINIGHIYWQNDQQKEALLSWISPQVKVIRSASDVR